MSPTSVVSSGVVPLALVGRAYGTTARRAARRRLQIWPGSHFDRRTRRAQEVDRWCAADLARSSRPIREDEPADQLSTRHALITGKPGYQVTRHACGCAWGHRKGVGRVLPMQYNSRWLKVVMGFGRPPSDLPQPEGRWNAPRRGRSQTGLRPRPPCQCTSNSRKGAIPRLGST